MIKILFNLFRTQFLKLAFSEQSKPVSFDKLEQCFIDSDGKRYFRFTKDDDIPILRKGKLELHLKELEMGLSYDNLEEILKYMETAINNGNKPNIARIGHAIEEIRNRKKFLIVPEIMFNLIGVLYIREDENPAKIDEEIHAAKIQQFTKDSQGGLYDFFYNSGLAAYIPYLSKLQEGWNDLWESNKARVNAFQQQIREYSSAQLS